MTDIQCSPGSKDGDNYMSLIKRIIVKIKQGNNNSGEFDLLSGDFNCKIAKMIPVQIKNIFSNVTVITLEN